jgi:hypothetical protein
MVAAFERELSKGLARKGQSPTRQTGGRRSTPAVFYRST